MHGTRQSWWAVALLSGVAGALLVLLLPLVPVKALGLPPYWLHLCIGVGVVVTLFVLTRNPAWRYLRAYSALIGFLGVANALPEFKLTVSSGGWVGHWIQEGVSWHLNMVLGGLAAVLVVVDYLTHRPLTPSRDKPSTPQRPDTPVWDDQFRRNRSQMLKKVRNIWITGVLEPSLDRLAHIELGLESKPEAVAHPFDLFVQRPQQPPSPLPRGTPICQVFDNAGQGLLILGEPGTGKTTLLLELTHDLLDRAEQDERHLIPVVFHLSSWVEQRLTLADWLVDELNKRYDVPRTLAKTWVDVGLILPLLDGLDEVAAAHRAACVDVINGFLNEHGWSPMVVCSRVADYEALTVRLRLSSAVIIQALSRQQITHYIDQAGASLVGLRTVLHNDERLWELLNTPLILNIMTFAYQGLSADEIPSSGTVEERRTHLWAAYTDAMFHRRAKASPYTRAQTEHWLTWLARAMQAHNQSVFYLEWIQPDWLPVQRQQRLVTFVTSVIGGLASGLLGVLFWVLLGALLFRPVRLGLDPPDGLAGLGYGLGYGLAFGPFLGLLGGLSVGITSPLIGGLLYGLPLGLLSRLYIGQHSELVVGLLGALVGGLSVGVVGYSKEIKPVEKLRWSWLKARYKWMNKLFKRLVVGLLGALAFGLLQMLVFGLPSGRPIGLLLGNLLQRDLRDGLCYGLLFGILGGLHDGFTVGEIGTQSFPNEGIKRSALNASMIGVFVVILLGLVLGLGSGVLRGVLGTLFREMGFGVVGGLFVGLVFGLVFGLRFGGCACLHHFALRLVLWHKNFAPLNYVHFLNYATARIFLRKVGGGYVFVHRMLLESFAARPQTSAEQQNRNTHG